MTIQRTARGILHALVIAAALLPMASLADASARVAPVAIFIMWIGARNSTSVLRGIYSLLAGLYGGAVFQVAVWPWVSLSGWLFLTVVLLTALVTFLTARVAIWWRGALAFGGVAVPLVVGFFVALAIASPFARGWSRAGL